MGLIIAFTGAHPILVSLSMMIFLRGLGEYLTRGGDISGFPDFIAPLGHGIILGIPVPLLIVMLAAFALWYLLLSRSRLGFATYMIGSNIEATRYSGVNTKRALSLIYALSGAMCALAGVIMLARFNSVRVGHGESYLLITVLACFLGRRGSVRRFRPGRLGVPGADHSAGPLFGPESAGSQPTPGDGPLGGLLISVMILRWGARHVGHYLKTRR